MDLVAAILKGIADERPIDGHIAIPSPLRDMIQHYNKLGLHDDNLRVITSLTSGSELKSLIRKMDPEQQVMLLREYSIATQSLDTPMIYAEPPDVVAARKLKHYLIKASFNVAVTLALISGGMFAMHAYTTGTLNQAALKTIMNAAIEIFKFILNTK